MRIHHWLVLTMWSVTMAACGRDEAADRDPVAGCDPGPTLTRIRTMPPVEFEAGTLTWVNDSVIGIVDQHDRQLVLLSWSGEEIARIGGEGGGPGEFKALNNAVAVPEGFVLAGALRLSWFDRAYRPVADHLMPGISLRVLTATRDTAWVAWIGIADQSPVIGTVARSTGKVTPLFRVFEADTSLKARILNGQIPVPWIATALAPDGTFLAAQRLNYRIARIDSSGQVKARFGRTGLEPRYRSDTDRAAERTRLLKLFQEAVKGRLPDGSADVADKVLREPLPLLLGPFGIDAFGRLWAATTREADATVFDLFAEDRFVTSVRLPGRGLAMAFGPGVLAFLYHIPTGPQAGQAAVDLYRLPEDPLCGS